MPVLPPPPPPLPNVCLGESHASATHLRIETDALSRLKPWGYHIFLAELPRDGRAAGERYFRSPRSRGDYEQFLAALVDLADPALPDTAREEKIGRLAASETMAHGIGLTVKAYDAGYQIEFADVPSRQWLGPAMLMKERNEAIAERIAAFDRQGVLAVNGANHVADHGDGARSIKEDLRAGGRDCETFALTIGGWRADELAPGLGWKRPAFDHEAASADEILSALEPKLPQKIPFARPGRAAVPAGRGGRSVEK
ncbi:MAG: hypothetical protein PW734_08860 [Verrucomicrobium sp.]|nr:hypothetical protein [Verrucomicrobium sp.]